MTQYKGSGNKRPTPPDVVRVPFVDESDLRPGQEGLLSKDQIFLNGYFEPVKSQSFQGGINYHFTKRPGLSSFLTVSPTGPGRGCHRWKTTGKLYSVNNNKILSGTTDLGVTLPNTSGFVDFAETRPAAAIQYLGINDGSAIYLIGSDDSVIVMNNKNITSSSVANPTHITATAHGLNSGNKIIIRNHAGSTPSINDTIYVVTVLDADHFTIPVNVTVGGAGGTIGSIPISNTGDLHYMDSYWFTLKNDGTVWNCVSDDPTTWPSTAFIEVKMLPGRGIGLAKQDNTLIAFTDRHFQMFYDAANPSGSPLSNIEEAMHQLGAVSTNAIASEEDFVYWISNTQAGGYTVYQLSGTTNLDDIGNATLNRSLTDNFLLTPGSPSAKQIILTAGSNSWTVPADFNKSNNTVEAIGGGGGGGKDINSPYAFGGNGGGGGAYAKTYNYDPGGAGSVFYSVGLGGAGAFSTGVPSSNGSDTTFDNSAVLLAKAGLGGNQGSTGGDKTTCFPTTYSKSGGNGGTADGVSLGGGGGGGGGAAGKVADGAVGGNSAGAGNGGTGGQGDPLLGGAGGAAGASGGIAGGNGTEWSTAGSGGGGGGGRFNAFNVGPNGGNGGFYGGGGGGCEGGGGSGTSGGNGANGVIVITYIPTTTVTDANAANGYILRVAGHAFYVLNLLNNKETWVYDQAHKIWCKWQSPVGDVWPIVNSVLYSPAGQPQVVVGQDPVTGTIWKIDYELGQDNNTNYEVRAQTIPLTFGNMKRKFYHQVELIGDRQTSSTPVVVTYTDDDYQTFSSGITFDLGNVRNFKRSLGNSRRRAWRVSYTGPNVLRIYGLEFTVETDNS